MMPLRPVCFGVIYFMSENYSRKSGYFLLFVCDPGDDSKNIFRRLAGKENRQFFFIYFHII